MKDLRDLHYFLGIEVIRTPEGILLRKRHYVLNMLFKFGMDDFKPISTPLDRTVKLRPKNTCSVRNLYFGTYATLWTGDCYIGPVQPCS